ncbi:MAG: hypothetical protein HOP06_04380 [Methylotenera sp.]|nr:hypothetical protein [Methylotenera sp.]
MSDNTYRRVGETSKCPACGVQVDEGAYRCPKCLIFFCYKCRRRVQQSENQSQCLNQKCSYYGKLLCKICVKQTPQFAKKSKEIKEDLLKSKHKLIAFTITLIVALILLFYIGLTGSVLLGSALILSIPLAFFFSNLKKSRLIEEDVIVSSVSCCIACEQPVEYLNTK